LFEFEEMTDELGPADPEEQPSAKDVGQRLETICPLMWGMQAYGAKG